MEIGQRKARMISLRLSNEEYEALRNRSQMCGFHSFSEWIRAMMHEVIGETVAARTPESKLQELDEKLKWLDERVADLRRAITERSVA